MGIGSISVIFLFANKINQMLSIQDYRNGRYQGQLKNKLPHGIGIFMQINLTFVIAEWTHGYIDGGAVVIFPDGSTFCGIFQHGHPLGTAFYELSHDNMKVIEILDEQEPLTAIILPLEGKIIQISKTNFEVTKEYAITGNQQTIELEHAARIMKLSDKEVKFYRDFPNCYTFFENYFCRQYEQIFEEIVITINGYKEYWMGFKEEGLGVKLEPVKDSYEFYLAKNKHNQELSKVHRCLDGKVYMIREMGMMSKQNTLVQYGLKTTNEMLKGYTIEEGVFELPHTIIRYQSTTERPRSCTQTFANHLKRSFHYVDTFMHLASIEQILRTKKLIEQDVINHNKEVLAHSLIQTPNKLKQRPIVQKEEDKVQAAESIQSSQKIKSVKKVQPIMYGDVNWSNRLMQVKKQIYNSIELKKANKSYVDYTNIAKKQDIPPKQPKQQIPIYGMSAKKEQINIDNRSRPSSYIKDSNPLKADSKNKEVEVIDYRKNGSITPRKQQAIPNRSPPRTNPINRYQRGEPIQNKPSNSRYPRQRGDPIQYKTPTKEPKEPERTSPSFILKNEKTKSTLKSSPSRPRIAYRDNSKQIQTIPSRQPKRQLLAAQKLRDDLPVNSKYSPYGNRSPQKSNLAKYIPARQNDSPSKAGYLARNKKKKLLNELDNFEL